MLNPNEIYERLTATGEEWADQNHAADLLEGTLKQVFSQCVLKYRQKNMPVSEAEHNAHRDHEYVQAREAAINARRDANKAKVRYNAAQAWFEAMRTAEATHRAAARAAP